MDQGHTQPSLVWYHTIFTALNDCNYGFILQINDHTWQWNCQPCWINLWGPLSSISSCSGATQPLLALGPHPTSTEGWFSRPFIIQLSLVNLNLSLFPLCFPYEPLLSFVLPSGLLSLYTSSISCPVCKHMTRISCQGYGDRTFLERTLSVASTQFRPIPHPVLKTIHQLLLHAYINACAYTHMFSVLFS